MATNIFNAILFYIALVPIISDSISEIKEEEYIPKQNLRFLSTEFVTATELNMTLKPTLPTINSDIVSNETSVFVPEIYWWEYYYYDYYYDYDYSYPDFTDFDGVHCQKPWQCKNQAGFHKYNLCFCDQLCVVYRDCCHDANVTSDGDIQNMSFRCQYIPGVYTPWFVFVIDLCPGGADYKLNEHCIEPNERNIYIRTPVSSLTTGFLYRNMYCAMCNGVVDYVFWKADFRCDWWSSKHQNIGNASIDELRLSNECFMFFQSPLPNITYRTCYPHVSTCPRKAYDSLQYDENIFNECIGGSIKYTFTVDSIYKNPSCYECNTDVKINDSDATCISGTFTLPNRVDPSRYRGLNSLDMLFDLSTQQFIVNRDYSKKRVEVTSFTDTCEPDEAYDPFSGDCKRLCETSHQNCTESQRNKQADTILKKCSHVTFDRNDFEFMNDTILQHLASGKLYNNFTLFNNSVIICIEKEPHVGLKPLAQLDDLLHLTANGISIMGLLATILIYIKTSVRKLSRKCLLCLSLSLLVAQSIILVGPIAEGNVVLCKVTSLVMHYSFMASFTWMNVKVYDAYYSFSRNFQHSVYNGDKLCLAYSLYAWLLPFVVVTTSFLTDEFSSWTYSPKYAEPTCWINDQNGFLLFFLGPLAVIMLSNMFFFSMSFRSICISYVTKSNDTPKQKPSQILINIKLSIVMGLPLVFRFLGNVVNNDIFWTLFVISNGLQGIFIFLGFALKPLIKLLHRNNSDGHIQLNAL